MAENLGRIRELLKRMVRRERLLLCVHALAQMGWVFCAFWLVAIVLAWVGADRGAGWFLLTLVVGLGGWFAVGRLLQHRWSDSGQLMRHARAVERERPEFQGSLLTVTERLEGPLGQESPLIFERIVDRTARQVNVVDPTRIHSAKPALFRVLAFALLVPFTFVLGLLSPGGFGGVAAWGIGYGQAEIEMGAAAPRSNQKNARVGDLVLRYIYPPYTGLEPLEVANSTGEAHGPPGTRVRVRLRSAGVIERAALVAYDAPPVEATVEAGRLVRGEFVIQADPGTYHVVLQSGEEAHPSTSFPIVPDPDLPPEVILDRAGTVYEVGVDEPLDLQWTAKDDYGVNRVALEIDTEQAKGLTTGRETKVEVGGVLAMRPLDLGLRPGNRVKLVVAAWDNDEWSGQKVGRSREVELVVLGARGLEMMSNERRIEVRDVLVDLLAGHLLDPWPPGSQTAEYSKWGEVLSRRYEPLQDLLTKYPAILRSVVTGRLISKVMDTGTAVVRFTQVSFDPFEQTGPPSGSIQTIADLRTAAIEEVEHSIVVLDRLIQQIAMRNMLDAVVKMDGRSNRLSTLAQGDVEPYAVTAELDQLERMLNQMGLELKAMGRGGIREFAENRQRELTGLFKEIKSVSASDEPKDLSMLLRRATREITELREELEYRLQQDEQQESELGKMLEQLVKELKSLERNQRQLQGETTRLREKDSADSAKEAESLWKRIEKKMAEIEKKGDRYVERLESSERLFFEIERAKTATDENSRLSRSIEARDLRKSFDNVNDALNTWDMVKRTAELERQRGRARSGPQPYDADQIQSELVEVVRLLQRLNEIAEAVSPELASAVRELKSKQSELIRRGEAARKLAREVAQQMPIQPRGLNEAMDEAVEQMRFSEESMEQGFPLPSEGAQGQAAERLKEAQESLQQAMQEMQQQARARSGRKEQSKGSERGKGGDEEQDTEPEDIEIPSPEDFRTPEDYRRALLEGMQGDVPEEYRGMKKRYYEGLVKQ